MSSSQFYRIEQEKLVLEADKISLFTKHAPTIGTYREEVLRDYIKSIIPRSLKVTSGFVSSNQNHQNLKEEQSRQIDVLIYDADSHVPLLETGSMSVIRPDALVGCIEVKSTLTFYKKKKPHNSKETDDEYPLGGGWRCAYRWAGTLIDSLINIKDCADACKSRKEWYFSGILAFSSTFEIVRLFEALDNCEIQRQLGINHLNQLPIAICILSKATALFFDVDIFGGVNQYVNEYESYCNVFEASEGYEEYPFQFFSVQAYNQIGYTYSKRKADENGLFSAIGSTAKIWSKHFELYNGDQ
ncbi:hypothetical protein HJ027_17310 [Vibrio parahaemolyticus]|nr:hypothetical protein [Vibrio parahaemolyticus]HCH4004135.1 hypothetical protein [Vibrio parahaemolyticus]